jgi:hypothetical protein
MMEWRIPRRPSAIRTFSKTGQWCIFGGMAVESVDVQEIARFTYCWRVRSSTCQANPATELSTVHVPFVHADLARLLDSVGESDTFLVMEVIVRSRRWHIPYRVQHAQFFSDQRCWNDWVECLEAALIELVALRAVLAGDQSAASGLRVVAGARRETVAVAERVRRLIHCIEFGWSGRRSGRRSGSALIECEALTSPGLAANGTTRHLDRLEGSGEQWSVMRHLWAREGRHVLEELHSQTESLEED